MYLDVFSLSALVDEFMDVLVGGRIQDSVSIDENSIGLEIYANHRRQYLYLSAENQQPRLHLVQDKLRRGLPRPTQLGLLIRSHVEGGVITHVSQPAWERILHLEIEGPQGEVILIIEPMERRSNLLLVKDGTIIDCLRRVGADENRYRVSLPAHRYVSPPPQLGKQDPFLVDLEGLQTMFAQNDDPKRKAQQVLTANLLGMSPLLAKEIIYRATGNANTLPSGIALEPLHEVMTAVLQPLKQRDWKPGIVEQDEVISAFSVYPMLSQPGWRPVATMSEALATYYGAPVGDEVYDAAKKPVHEAMRAARIRLETRLAALKRSMTDESEREYLRQSGELILAYQYAITPGQTELRAVYDADDEVVIPIDSTMTPLENAQRYFERYNKAKRALDDVPGLIHDTESEITFIAQLGTDLELASNWPDIEEVQSALKVSGYWQGKAPIRGGAKSAPLRIVTPEGFIIWVGRNSRQNEQVTFDKGSPLDTWLHARGVPGAHVIIKNDGRRILDTVIDTAAALAAYYSASRSEAKVIVDVVGRRDVKKIKGGRPGMVTYRNEETRTVAPRPASDFMRS